MTDGKPNASEGLTQEQLEGLLSRLPRMQTLTDLRQEEGLKLTWILEGLIAQGMVTILASKGKSGKTTWLQHLLRSLFNGDDTFLDLKIVRTPALVISEEPQTLWRDRFPDLPDGVPLHFMCKPFLGKPDPEEWTAFCRNLADVLPHLGVKLVVMDPIVNLIPGDENSSKGMMEFLAPLQALTSRGIAVLLSHHPTKAGDPLRGSSALEGYVDIIVQMKQPAGMAATRVRELAVAGRNGLACQAQVFMQLSEDWLSYRRLASAEEAAAVSLTGVIFKFLETVHSAATAAEIRDGCPWPDGHPPSDRVIHNIMKDGLNKAWTRFGNGGHGSPYRYRLIRPLEAVTLSPPSNTSPGGSGE